MAACRAALRSVVSRTQQLRHALHAHPRVSGDERETAARISTFLREEAGLRPVLEGVGGGHGLVYELAGEGGGDEEGGVVLLRADMDALPLVERSGVAHVSVVDGVHHACGHDGHSAMLAGALLLLSEHPPARAALGRGRVLAVFQPAEETGEGARRMLECAAGGALLSAPHVTRGAFGFHNIPGAPLADVMLRRPGLLTSTAVAARASCGLRLSLCGTAAHASEPSKGQCPMLALGRLAAACEGLPARLQAAGRLAPQVGEPALSTPVQLQCGNAGDFGILPAHGSLSVTLRADCDAGLAALKQELVALAEGEARAGALRPFELAVEEHEPFPATENDGWCTSRVADAVVAVAAVAAADAGAGAGAGVGAGAGAGAAGGGTGAARVQLPLLVPRLHAMSQPFPWSEDFGRFASSCGGGALIGLGAGADFAPLHSESYDFPDELLPLGTLLWTQIATAALGSTRG
jgi:amidohydrolase